MHLYEEIEAYVIDLIHSGKLREGDQIPKEMDLAAQFHASRPTVRQALARLTMNGVITRTKGRGSFVSRKKLRRNTRVSSQAIGMNCRKKDLRRERL